MKRLLVLLVSLLFSLFAAEAGVLTPGLIAAYESRGASAIQPTIILLAERPTAAGFAEDLLDQGNSLPETHTRIMEFLQSAGSGQEPVLRSLNILTSTGMAANIKPLWIVNAIACNLTRPGAELIANMNEVEAVGLDDPVMLRTLLETTTANNASRTDDDFSHIAITEAWRMGFRGEGRTVCVLADGAANASAISTRWRGQNAPLSESWYDRAGGGIGACGDVGTAMLGMLCGTDQNGDAFGVAPDASWIAARLVCSETRLSDVLFALQWAADPDGNANTFSDVPDAICNAWGLNDACTSGAPEGVWDVVSNVEALGPLLIFAAQQDNQSGSASVRMPESLENCFAVGNADASGTVPVVHSSSGRGPSPCDPTLVKPDVCAPGTWMRTITANGVVQSTGTALAAARVAGVAVLLRQANPNLPASEIHRVLTMTAADYGSPGPDNAFGFGLVNAERALNMALSSGRTGSIQGTVLDGNEPVAAARVVLTGPFGELLTNARTGFFSFDHVTTDHRYTLRVGRFGYRPYFYPDSITVESGRPRTLTILLERWFDDDAEFDQGWSLGVDGDNATSGLWVRAVPVGLRAGGKLVQPDADASPLGSRCFVTGNASSPSADPRESDVDGGRTTLRSPLFSLLGMESPVVKFSYWYSNDLGSNPGADFFRAQISADGGATWMNLINTAASTNGWTTVSVRVGDFVTPTDRMLLQFIAEDAGPGSLVKAAVDDISITGAAPDLEPPRDLTLDVQSDYVRLIWRQSPGAISYRVYLSGSADRVIAPENLYTTVSDTTLTVPMSDIRFNEFFFQVTASK
jgi:hypothetical protein